MQTCCRTEVFKLLAKSVGQPRQTAAAHPHRQILTFNVGPENFVAVWIPSNYMPLRTDTNRRTVIVRVRMSAAENHAVKDAADKSGNDISKWARNVMLNAVR